MLTIQYGVENKSYVRAKIWELLPEEMKNSSALTKIKIRKRLRQGKLRQAFRQALPDMYEKYRLYPILYETLPTLWRCILTCNSNLFRNSAK